VGSATRVIFAVLVSTAALIGPAAGGAGAHGNAVTATSLGGFLPLAINGRGQVLGVIDADTDRLTLLDGERLVPVAPVLAEGEHVDLGSTWFNARGDVAGTVEDVTPGDVLHRPFLWSDGRQVDLGVTSDTQVAGLSDRGQVLMLPWSPEPGEPQTIWVWDHGNVVTPPRLPAGAFVFPAAMGSTGWVSGGLNRPDQLGRRQVVWRPGGPLITFDPGCATQAVSVAGINAAGEVIGNCGFRGFVWRPGRGVTQLPVLDPSLLQPSVAMAINDRGHVVVGVGSRLYLWRDDQMVPITDRDDLAFTAINNRDEVVVSRELSGDDSPPFGHEALLWRDGHVTNLDEIAGAGRTSVPQGINDRGDVIGLTGLDASARLADLRGVLWTRGGRHAPVGPVEPPPATTPGEPASPTVDALIRGRRPSAAPVVLRSQPRPGA
jgi:hypothetical protein